MHFTGSKTEFRRSCDRKRTLDCFIVLKFGALQWYERLTYIAQPLTFEIFINDAGDIVQVSFRRDTIVVLVTYPSRRGDVCVWAHRIAEPEPAQSVAPPGAAQSMRAGAWSQARTVEFLSPSWQVARLGDLRDRSNTCWQCDVLAPLSEAVEQDGRSPWSDRHLSVITTRCLDQAALSQSIFLSPQIL